MGVFFDGIRIVTDPDCNPSQSEMGLDDYYSLQMLLLFHPEAAPEQIDAWKRSPPSPSRRCLLCTDPPCSALLEQPFATLLNKKRWPTHLSREVRAGLNAQWIYSLQKRARDCGMDCDVDELIKPTPQPLPIGRMSIQRRYESRFCLTELPTPLLPFLPFDGDEYATLVISGQYLSVDLTLFFMASNANGSLFHASGFRWQVGGARHVTTGVTKLIANAERFWAVFEGRDVADIGRPLALTDKDILRIRNLSKEYGRIMREAGATNISQADFAIFVKHDVKTLRPFMKRHRIPWPRISID